MQKHSRSRGGKQQRNVQTFPLTIDGHRIDMTRDQVIANGQGWKRCHGQYGDTKVNSLSIKRLGNKIFVKDGRKLSGFLLAELSVALPEIQTLIDQSSQTAITS